jgi:hypothetical protein
VSFFDNANLLSVLNSFGDVIETKYKIDYIQANKIIKKYEDRYQIYNPRDVDNQRFGLSLTSLDGGMSGVPDLDSLSQYRIKTGIEYLEKDFNVKTPLLQELEPLCDVFADFDLGRSHIIKLDKGGHFPPHRDLDDTFRLIAFIDYDPPEGLVFMLENQSLHLKQGVFYFVNTIKYHSLFSFANNNKFIVLNVILDEKNIHQLVRQRHYR